MIFSKLQSFEEREPKTLDYWLSIHFQYIFYNVSLVPFTHLQAIRRHLLVATNDMLFLKL